MTTDRREFMAGIGALSLAPSVVSTARAAAADPLAGKTAMETLAALGGKIAEAGAGEALSWIGTQVFNGIFGTGSDLIAAQLDKIIELEGEILRQLGEVKAEVDWQGALTRVQPAISQINAYFQSAQDDLASLDAQAGARLQKEILSPDTRGIKSALDVIHQELVGDTTLGPGTPGLLQLWRDRNWPAYTRQNNVSPYAYVRNMHNYLRSVFMLQLKGLTLYVSAVLAAKGKDIQQAAATDQDRLLALRAAKTVYDNMSKQSDVLYDAVGHVSDLFNDYAPHPSVSGLPADIDPRALVPGFEITYQAFGVTWVLGSQKSDIDTGPYVSGFTKESLDKLKAKGLSTEWFLRGDNQLTCYPRIQRISGWRDKEPHELNMQVRLLPGKDNTIEIAEWDTTLGPEEYDMITGPQSWFKVSRFMIRPTGNYFILWGFANIAQPFRANGPPIRCL